MKVSELFLSIQGEGLFSGYPFTIVRLSGCNLRCRYCDTKYAWEGGRDVSLKGLLKEIETLYPERVLITGGEPLLQEESIELMRALLERGAFVSLETNGSLPIKNVPRKVHIVMDIKTPGSGEEDSFFQENLLYLKKTDEVKFVVTGKSDYIWAKEFMKRLPPVKVNISPAHGVLDAKLLAQWMIDDRLDARLNLQIHKYIWGNQRGR